MLLLYRKQVLLILRLKWIIFLRLLKQIPIPYIVLLFILAVSLMSILLTIDVPITWKSLSAAVLIYVFLCSQTQYQSEKVWFLKQYKYMLSTSYIVDFLFLTIPFFLLNPIFGIITCVVAVFCGVFRAHLLRKPKINIIIQSPFFIKSSYLWHAQMRYLFPLTLIFIATFIIIGRLNENPNLAFVVFGGGVFLACLTTIFQMEKSDFVQMYINEWHFMKQTAKEVTFNTISFGLLPTLMMFFLFPNKWWIALLMVLSIILLNTNALWIKYAFFPSPTLALILFLVSIVFLGAIAATIYGLLLVPVYYALLFRVCKNNIQKILAHNERIDN